MTLSRSCKRVIALILGAELKSAELAQTLHGGRFKGDDDRAGDSDKGPRSRSITAARCGRGPCVAIRLEGEKNEAGVGRAASKAETGDREDVQNIRKSLGDRVHLWPIFRVYSNEAPVGAWIATMRYP